VCLLQCVRFTHPLLRYETSLKTALANPNLSPAIIIRTPNFRAMNIATVIRASISTRTATCLLFDAHGTIPVLLARLPARQAHLRLNPLAFLSILFEEYGYMAETERARLDAEIVALERRTGMSVLSLEPIDPDKIDYKALTEDLHVCATALISVENVVDFEVAFGAFCSEVMVLFEELRGRRGLEKLGEDENEALSQTLAYHRNKADRRRAQLQSLLKRVQTQINLVRPLSVPSLNLVVVFRDFVRADSISEC